MSISTMDVNRKKQNFEKILFRLIQNKGKSWKNQINFFFQFEHKKYIKIFHLKTLNDN